ncbi:GxxExxY protein [Variovorax sp. PCZ-1]|uniref:GxxExxY protein n=1 Tax=Variovorax sp. PCZ-1 TaxID=2835533 RepID=UPI001BCAB4A4|nr:GxxExxY protein [Variovorax sp. PCZ-1]MBS7806201.1 GxxExxY protein [Variovorax sp. PCZ-1]
MSNSSASRLHQKNAKDTEETQKTPKEVQWLNALSHRVIGACVEVQQHLGVGLLESAYSNALAIELESLGIEFEREWAIEGNYKGKPLGVIYRADFLLESSLILELKAVESILEEHRAQLLTYLRTSAKPLGLLLNFHAQPIAKFGVRRLVHDL